MRRMGWARSAPVRALREFVQMVGVKNVMRKELSVEVYGLDEFRQLDGPALIVANHASHLDTAVLLSTLPTRRRRHTAVAIEADYFFDSWWRASGSAIAFNTCPIQHSADAPGSTPVGVATVGRGGLSRRHRSATDCRPVPGAALGRVGVRYRSFRFGSSGRTRRCRGAAAGRCQDVRG